jgi:cell wall-associated NlpC family hydrolase
VQRTGTTTRRWRRAVLVLTATLSAGLAGTLAPASAAPATAADAAALVQQAGAQLAQIDEQVQQAELVVAQQQQAAQAAAVQAAAARAAVDAYQPQLRAIAQSGYTGQTSSIAAFLTSQSAGELVDRMTTLDMIAGHVESVIAAVAVAQEQAAAAQAAADQAAGQAQSSLAQLQQQQKQLQDQADQYQADFERLTAAQQAQVTTALAGPTLSAPDPDSIAAPTEAVAVAIKTALVELGKPYVYGAAGPNGFDCSGLTMFAYAAAGVSLPHSSAAQSRMGTAVSRADLQPGDLVYFYSPVSHVGLYIGDGKMVHARTFGSPVAVTSVDMSGYAGARRIVGG